LKRGARKIEEMLERRKKGLPDDVREGGGSFEAKSQADAQESRGKTR